MRTPDTAAVTALVEHVAATVVRPRFRALEAGDISSKAAGGLAAATAGDIVTVVDQQAEVALTAGLRALDPGAVVVGEEAVAEDPRLLDALADAPVAYLIDPIDGTQAFVDGVGEYAVMVSRLVRGEAVATWVHLPEEERTFVAERGAGAWVEGRRLTADPAAAGLDGLTGGFALFYATPQQREAVAKASGFATSIRQGGRLWSGWFYTRLALGEVDFLSYWRCHPWDHAPGAVLAREVGGVSRTLDGADYRPTGIGGPLLVARTPAIWDRIAATLPR